MMNHRSCLVLPGLTLLTLGLLLSQPFIMSAQGLMVPDSLARDIPADLEAWVEDLSGQKDENFDALEMIQDNSHKLLNINTINQDDLVGHLLLSPLQARNLTEYIQETGPLLTPYELQLINGFDPVTIRRITSGITVSLPEKKKVTSFKDLLHHWHGQASFRYAQTLESQKGYAFRQDTSLIPGQDNQYLGAPSKMLMRFSAKSGDLIAVGLTAEKDAGEEFFANSQKRGFDFYSGYLLLRPSKTVSTVIIGDFRLSFGQGLTLNTSSSLRMMNGLYEPYKGSGGLKPYGSSNESGFLRGAAGVIRSGRFDLTLFVSRKKVDSRIESYDSVNQQVITASSPLTDGYHRTINELSRKNALEQLLAGGHFGYKNSYLHLGFTFFRMHYDAALAAGEAPYEKFAFAGKANHCAGLDTRILLPHAMLFAEASLTSGGSAGLIAGLYLYSNPRFRYTLVYRNYGRAYDNPFGRAAGILGTNVNETGITVSVLSLISSKLTLTLNADLHRFPWLRYRTDRPSNGAETLILVGAQPSRNTSVSVRYLWRTGEENGLDPYRKTALLVTKSGHRVRVQFVQQMGDFLQLSTQVHWILSKNGSAAAQYGYLIAQDLIFTFRGFPCVLALRYALFDTDDYESRIYSYERDVMYAFSAPAYYSKGVRINAMIRYTLFHCFDLWVRFSTTVMTQDDSIGSGPEEISGNTKSELKLQIRYTF